MWEGHKSTEWRSNGTNEWRNESLDGSLDGWVDSLMGRWRAGPLEMRGKALKPKGRVTNCAGGLLWLTTDWAEKYLGLTMEVYVEVFLESESFLIYPSTLVSSLGLHICGSVMAQSPDFCHCFSLVEFYFSVDMTFSAPSSELLDSKSLEFSDSLEPHLLKTLCARHPGSSINIS